MKRSPLIVLATAAFALFAIGKPATAGIADSPLPLLSAGATTFHLYSVPGVLDGPIVRTYFSCTSTDTATMQVGVELFASPGFLINDAVATSVSVDPGATVVFGTGPTNWLGINNLGGGSAKGSARILATSKKLVCTVFVADPNNGPPTSAWQLNVLRKKTQKGD